MPTIDGCVDQRPMHLCGQAVVYSDAEDSVTLKAGPAYLICGSPEGQGP